MKKIKWEYFITDEAQLLGELGNQGWELVAVAQDQLYLKRPAPSLSEQITMEQRKRAIGGEGPNETRRYSESCSQSYYS